MQAMQNVFRNSSCVVSGGQPLAMIRLVRTERYDSSATSRTATGSLLGR